MSMIDAYCTGCGEILETWDTESGDRLMTRPCKNHCQPDDNNYQTDEDYNDYGETQ